MVLLGGAHAQIFGAAVERNEGIGILVDGDGTSAELHDMRIADNGDRGVWAQKLAGTADAPALAILGDGTVIERNHIAGVGATESRGITIGGGAIRGTIAAKVVTDISGSGEQVGDGVGLFASTGAVLVENVRIEANDRAAGLVDAPSDGIVVQNATVTPGASNLAFVVQRAAITVSIPPSLMSRPPSPLGVNAPEITVDRTLLE
jgi:hypothetical protein